MLIVYNVLLMIGTAIGLPFVLLSLMRPKRRATFWHRLGWTIGDLVPSALPGEALAPIWVHALSVGEVVSAQPLIDHLRDCFPGECLVFSASTQTGMETARKLFVGKVASLFYFPYDLFFAVRHIVNHVRPRLVVIVETDLWPNFLSYLERRRIPCVLVNARLSTESFRGYRLLGRLSRRMVQSFCRIGAQSNDDASRFRALGVFSEKVAVTGNIKFDQPEVIDPEKEGRVLRCALGIECGRPVILFGSTHAGEENAALEAFLKLKARFRNLLLVVAPRDPARAAGVEKQLGSRGLKVHFLPALQFDPHYGACDVLIVNTIGILRRLYAIADIVFVGGSLVREGGHNPLEPAAAAKPILFGPDMSDFKDIAEQLVTGGGALRLSSAPELPNALDTLLADSPRRLSMGGNALKIFLHNKGSIEKTMKLIRGSAEHESDRQRRPAKP